MERMAAHLSHPALSFLSRWVATRSHVPAFVRTRVAADDTLYVAPVRSRADLLEFVRLPHRIYRNDPHRVEPLEGMQCDRLTPGKDPFWTSAERELFLAWRGGTVVGTIAAIVDRGRLEAKSDATGAFGYFECEDDLDTARGLVHAARNWLRAKGMRVMEGPYNPSASDEHGILVEGFDTRPAIMEGHHPAYYGALVENAGLAPWREAYAWRVRPPVGEMDPTRFLPERLTRGAARARSKPGVRFRDLDLSRWDDEVVRCHALYNSAMASVPDFVPMDLGSFQQLCGSFRSFVEPRMVRFCEVDGKMVGYAIALPDVNEALQQARGKLFSWGAVKMWWRSRSLSRAVFKVLVIDPAYRMRGLESALIEDVARAMLSLGYREADLSLTGEENVKINMILAGLGFTIYRRYRLYRGEL